MLGQPQIAVALSHSKGEESMQCESSQVGLGLKSLVTKKEL